MATITSTTSGNWSVGGTWVGGVKPADGDAVVIAAGHSVLMDDDTSYMTGLLSVTIQGHATTPATLYWKNGTNGILRIRSGYAIVGTSGTQKGRLIANSDGVFNNKTPLSASNRALIHFIGSAYLDCTYLTVQLFCAEPIYKYVRTYGTKYDFIASSGTVDTVNNTIDFGVAPPAAGTTVQITALSGILPGGLEEGFRYYTRSNSGTKCKLCSGNNDATIIPLTSVGSGLCTLFTGYNTGTTLLNTFENVTTDSCWSTASGYNFTALCNSFALDGNRDLQFQRMTAITPSSITIDIAANSDQRAGARLYLISRNVSIKNDGATSSTSYLVSFPSQTVAYSGDFQCGIGFEGGIMGRCITYGYPCTYPSTMMYNTYYGLYGPCANPEVTVKGTYVGVYYGPLNSNRGGIVTVLCDSSNSAVWSHYDAKVVDSEFRNTTYIHNMSYNFVMNSGTIVAGCYCPVRDSFNGKIECEIKNVNYGIMSYFGSVRANIRDCLNSAIYYSSPILYDCSLYRNVTSDIAGTGRTIGYRTSLLSPASFSWSTEYSMHDDLMYHCFYDLNGQKGQVKAYTAGGNTITEAAPATPPVTLPYAYKMTCTSTYNNWNYVDFPILVEGGKLIRILIYEKCNANPSTFTIGPKFILCRNGYNLYDANEILVEKTAQNDGGNDTNWHTITMDYRAQYDEQLILRVMAKDTAKYFHWMYALQTAAVAVLQFRGV